MTIKEFSPWRNKETLLGSAMLIAAVVYLVAVARFPDTAARYRAIAPSFLPNLLGIVLVILSGLLIVQGIRAPKAAILEIETSKANGIRTVALLGLFILFVRSFRFVGFAPSSFLFVTALQFLLGERRIIRVLLLAVAITGVLYLIFVVLLRVPLPRGVLADLF
jgi:putative tricarboxylic transport membrane protein